MLLKNQKGQKQSNGKSAYRRGEKAMLFLKRVVLVISVLVLSAFIVYAINKLDKLFHLKDIIVTGNKNLEEDEIKDTINIGNNKGLLRISLKDVDRRLKALPWIRNVYLKKQFPDTLMVRVEEAAPAAILNLDNNFFLIDAEVNILEEIKEGKTPFLPVISEIDPKTNRADVIEALKLIEELSKNGILSSKEFVEITLKPYGLSMNMDGELFKVGHGRYQEKFQKWMDIEPEVRKRGITIEYIDLRFAGRVIVKPLKIKKSKSVPEKSSKGKGKRKFS
ncbi:MAG: FtsQ-type POTRA domain-containing protein [Nitrospirae bacterium]|nr:FtsQ-type POTRA domain-containing protein [Nitrospirota bacterium]